MPSSHTLRHTTLGTALITLLLTGCSPTETGTPTPAADANSTTADRHGAPPVDKPLDPGRFLDQPCSLLTPQQVREFGSDKQGEFIDQTGAPGCSWISFGLAFLTGNENGLADLYASKDEYKYFIETTVNGYPAVRGSQLDRRDDGYCAVEIGISKHLTISSQATNLNDGRDPCQLAERTAAAAIDTIKAEQ